MTHCLLALAARNSGRAQRGPGPQGRTDGDCQQYLLLPTTYSQECFPKSPTHKISARITDNHHVISKLYYFAL